ncbi:MAG: amidohydrolase family protein [Clostridia bacterium]|nr:amidohydrolase family protein [Clostridia bacterium]
MIIDIHSHVYKHPLPLVTRFFNPEELIAKYDELGIDKAVLLPVVNSEIYFPQSVDEVLEVCEEYPDRFIPYCNIDPRAMTNSSNAPLYKALEYYKNKGCKGVGEVMPNMPLMHPMVQNLFAAAEQVELPIVYDGSDQLTGDFGLYDDPGLPQLEHTLQRFPKLKIFGHGPLFWAELGKLKTPGERGFIFTFNGDGNQVGRCPEGPIEEGVVPTLLRRYENLHCDLSDATPVAALSRDKEFTAKFINEFQDRLYFGTDLCNIDMDVPQVRFFKGLLADKVITEEIYDKITYKNAVKLFDLK